MCVCPLQDLFEAVLARPATFHYELERLYGKPFGDPSEATPTTWLPRLVRKRFRVWFLVRFNRAFMVERIIYLLFEPFIHKNDDFTKTGSGQTQGKQLKKNATCAISSQ